MAINAKFFRYYYWLAVEFIKKHLRMILLSFFLSFFILVSLVSFSPLLNRFFFTRKQVIGIVGAYNLNNLPDEILQNISHGLVYINDKGEIIPALASSWEMLKGGQEFQFHLKNNLVWDDGKNFTTKDLQYQFKDVEVKKIDDYTLYFTLKKKLPIFPTYLTKPILRYPLHGVVGLYKIDNFKLRQGVLTEIDLSPNKNDLPLMIYKFYGDENELIDAYKTGEINQMTLYRKSLADPFLQWKNTTVKRSTDYSRVMTLFFNFKTQQLQDKGFREAVALSLPYDQLTKFGEPANGPIPPTSWAYNPDLKSTVEDLATAKNTFQKDSKNASASAKLKFQTFYDYLTTANLIDNKLKEAGLKTNLTLSPVQTADFDLLLAFWQIPKDPDQYFFWHSTQIQSNFLSYKSVKVDKLLEDGRSVLKPADRKNFYLQFQKALTDDVPAIFLYYPYAYTVQRR